MMQILVSAKQAIKFIHLKFKEHPLFGPLAFCLITVPLLLPPFGGASTDAVKFAFVLISIGLVLLSAKQGMQGHTNKWLMVWTCVWLVVITVSTFLSRDSLFAFLGNYPRYNSSWIAYASFAGLISVSVYLGKAFERTIVGILLIVSFFVAIFGLIQSFGFGYYGGIESFFAAIPDRVPSLIGNPNFSSWWIACLLPFGLFNLVRTKVFYQRVLWFGFVFVSCWSLSVFASRGAIASAMVGYAIFTIFAFFVREWRTGLALIFTGLVIVTLFAGYFELYRVSAATSVTSFQDSSANDRFVAWFMAGEMLHGHKYFGIGPGNFDQYYWEKLPSALMGGEQYFDDPHNVLLSVATDLGWVGFVVFASLFGLVAVLCTRALKYARSWELWMPAVCGVAVWLVAGLFNPAVLTLWMLLAVLLGFIFMQHAHQSQTFLLKWPRAILFRGLGLVSLVLAVALVTGEYVLVYSSYLESYSNQFSGALHRQQTLTHIASVLEPFNQESQYAYIAVQNHAGVSPEVLRHRIERVYKLHPFSARGALLAAQVSGELWYRSNNPEDFASAERYLKIALLRSAGYPVADAWAANFYFKTNKVELTELFAHYAAAKQPHYFNNWLLLAKLARERGNVHAMEYALEKAQSIVPRNTELAKLRKQLHDSGSPKAVDFRIGMQSVMTLLH